MSATLAAGLRELAEREAATPEGRERVVAALRETLAEVEAATPMIGGAEVIGACRRLAGDMILLGDRFEWLIEQLISVSPPPG